MQTGSAAQDPAAASEGADQAAFVDFEELKTNFLKLVKSNRAKAEAIMKDFGLAKLSEAKEAIYGKVNQSILAAS
jgi:hypothetical protein